MIAGSLVEKYVACQSRKSDFGWHLFSFSPCLMRKRVEKSEAILALLDSFQSISNCNIAEIPKAEREITFISERIKSLPAVNPPSICRLVIFDTYIVILPLTLVLKGLALIHVHNYESGSHQSDLQGKPTCSPALPSHWLLLVRILHYDWNTIIGYSKINRLYFQKI